jgi:general secretion pathway protein J
MTKRLDDGPAQQGFKSLSRSAQQGFTLIELLVSLMIFALLASAGVILLRGSVDTQQAVRLRLDALADVQRGIATLDSDLSQTVVRISRTQSGGYAPAFFGRRPQSGEPLMEFVRGGWSNPSGQRHPSLQRIEYWWRDGRLERVGYDALDGARPSEPSTLFADVTALELRYRDADGRWRDIWSPERPGDLPRAVELTLSRKGEAPLTLRFLLGPETEPAAPSAPPEGTGDAG